MTQQGAIAFNVSRPTGIVAIGNGYSIREPAEPFGAKYLSGGVDEFVKPKSWVITTSNEYEVRKTVRTLKKGAALCQRTLVHR